MTDSFWSTGRSELGAYWDARMRRPTSKRECLAKLSLHAAVHALRRPACVVMNHVRLLGRIVLPSGETFKLMSLRFDARPQISENRVFQPQATTFYGNATQRWGHRF